MFVDKAVRLLGQGLDLLWTCSFHLSIYNLAPLNSSPKNKTWIVLLLELNPRRVCTKCLGFELGKRRRRCPSTGSRDEKSDWTNRQRQQLTSVPHGPALLSAALWAVARHQAVTSHLLSYHWLPTDLDALLPSSSETMLCAAGVTLEDNIVPKHCLKVDPKRKGADCFTFTLRLLG